jgi:hypothetical protein
MGYDIISVIELFGICAAALWFVGFCALLVAVRKARREFRSKGYMRPPSGRRWLSFLLWKRYNAFESPGARFFFGISHFCLVALFIVLGIIVLLLGCELLLGNLPEGS